MGPTPRRLRRRLLVVMLALGLLPVVGWAAVSHALTTRLFEIRAAQLETLLARVDDALARDPEGGPLRREVAVARVNLAQAELARRSLSRLLPRLLGLTLAATAAALALSAILLGRQLARPLELVAQGMARYAQGDLQHRLPLAAGAKDDELQLLVRQFNRMGDELAAQRARLEVSEAIAAWQGVARALAHELKNPLTAMRMAVARLSRPPRGREGADESERRRRDSLGLIEGQIETLLRLAQSFSTFAKLPAPQLRDTRLSPIVEEVCALYGQASEVPVECALDPALEVRADAGLLGRALGNLVKNAVEASPPGAGPVHVSALPSGRFARIDVSDRGCGIGAVLEGAALARSLGTTKSQGSGLGLPIAHRILHEHGGTLRLEPRPGGGAVAVALVPLAGRESR
jgi:nitrogen fixation/metabolism regulation signal transduction histidine kinase